jgi:hypothetical protein
MPWQVLLDVTYGGFWQALLFVLLWGGVLAAWGLFLDRRQLFPWLFMYLLAWLKNRKKRKKPTRSRDVS